MKSNTKDTKKSFHYINFTKREKDLITQIVRMARHLEVEDSDTFYKLMGANPPTHQELSKLEDKAIKISINAETK